MDLTPGRSRRNRLGACVLFHPKHYFIIDLMVYIIKNMIL